LQFSETFGQNQQNSENVWTVQKIQQRWKADLKIKKNKRKGWKEEEKD